MVVLTGHLYAAGTRLSELSERKIQKGNLEAVSHDAFDDDVAYVALGHLHLAQTVGGRENVRYAGSPIPLALSEAGYRHEVVLVELPESGAARVETIPIPRSVEILRLPEEGPGTLAEVLRLLEALPSDPDPERLGPDRRSYLEVRLLLEAGEPPWKSEIEQAVEGKAVRLLRIERSSTGTGDAAHEQTDRSARRGDAGGGLPDEVRQPARRRAAGRSCSPPFTRFWRKWRRSDEDPRDPRKQHREPRRRVRGRLREAPRSPVPASSRSRGRPGRERARCSTSSVSPSTARLRAGPVPGTLGVPVGGSGAEAETLTAQDPRHLLRRGAGEGFAEADFVGSDGLRYRARWEVRRARRRPTGKFQKASQTLCRLDQGEEVPIADGASEVDERVGAALGLSFEQFRKAVLLAQGDFAAFLRAKERERSELLEKITGAEIYSKLSVKAWERGQNVAAKLKTLDDTLARLVPMDAEERSRCEVEAADGTEGDRSARRAPKAPRRGGPPRRRGRGPRAGGRGGRGESRGSAPGEGREGRGRRRGRRRRSGRPERISPKPASAWRRRSRSWSGPASST